MRKLRLVVGLGLVAGLSLIALGEAAQAAQWFHYGYTPGTCNFPSWTHKPDGYWQYLYQAAVYFTPEGYEAGPYRLDTIGVHVNQDGGIPAGVHVQTVVVKVYEAGAGGASNPAPGTLLYTNYFDVGAALDTLCGATPCPDGAYVQFDLNSGGLTPPEFNQSQDFIVGIEVIVDGITAFSEPMISFCGDGFNGEPPAAYRNRIRYDSPLTWAFSNTTPPPDDFDGDFIMDVTTTSLGPGVPALKTWGAIALVLGLSLVIGATVRRSV